MRLFGKKLLVFYLALSLVLSFAGLALAADNPFAVKAPSFKTGVIKYKMSGSTKGKATLYIKGTTTAKHTDSVTKVFGMSTPDKKIVVTSPKKVITVDLEKRSATSTGNMMTYMAEEYEKLSKAEQKTVRKNAEKMGYAFMSGLGNGKPEIKKGKYKGKPVDIVTVMGFTSYTWTGTRVPLRVTGSLMGIEVNEEAVDIKTGGSVPADAFKVPSGIKVKFDQNADNKMRNMAKSWMDMLKDPEFGKGNGNSAGGTAGFLQSLGASSNNEDSSDKAGSDQAEPPAQSSDKNEGDSLDPALKQGMKMLKGLFD